MNWTKWTLPVAVAIMAGCAAESADPESSRSQTLAQFDDDADRADEDHGRDFQSIGGNTSWRHPSTGLCSGSSSTTQRVATRRASPGSRSDT